MAIEKGIKSRVESEITQMHHASQKPAGFNGFTRTYRKLDDASEDLPAESMKVQQVGPEMLRRAGELWSELVDITASKDQGNTQALADVTVAGRIIIKEAPVPFLLWLEKHLNDVRTFIDKMPTLDPAEEWQPDITTGLYKTAPTTTHRTRKTAKPIVLYDATPQHPAQTQLISEDVLAGYWDMIKYSGALTVPRRKQLLERVDALSKAVKEAREAANMTEAPDVSVGKDLFDFLLS